MLKNFDAFHVIIIMTLIHVIIINKRCWFVEISDVWILTWIRTRRRRSPRDTAEQSERWSMLIENLTLPFVCLNFQLYFRFVLIPTTQLLNCIFVHSTFSTKVTGKEIRFFIFVAKWAFLCVIMLTNNFWLRRREWKCFSTARPRSISCNYTYTLALASN